MTTLDQSTYRGRTLTARLEPRASDGEMGVLRDTTVKVTWFAPSSIAFAHYPSIKRAKEASRRRNGESFLGRKISAQMQPPSIRQTESFTVIITGLSPDINEQHLRRFMACDTVTIRPPRFDAATGVRRLKATLDVNDGCLESFDVQDHAPGDVKMKGLARYSSVGDAKDAVLLNGEKMDYLNGSVVWLSHLQSVKFAMPRRQYVALEPQITTLQRGVNAGDKELRWTVFDRASDGTPAPIVTVRIAGDDIPSLGKMKVKMETLLFGDVIRVDDENIWDDHLLSVEGHSAIADLAESVGAYARCDSVRHHLALYGSGIACAAARTLILAEVSRMQTRRHVIELGPEIFSRLVRTGLAQLRTQYGADRIGLDLVHRHLIVRVDHPSQLAAIRTFLPQMERLVASSDSSVECPVCTCDVSDAVILSCNHQYCGSCLDLLLESSSTFPVVCLAENCNTPIPIPVFKTRLTLPKVDALLDKAGKAYINEHPNEFKFCPSPDCVHVYRPGPEGSAIQCKGCLAHICPACHVVAHAGLTCAERRLESDPAERAYRRWKIENQVKPCPHCGVDIQKSAGCNHMTCSACKTHMCWVCMATFPDGRSVYDHMRKSHGGFGV
ncbi:hypothetical protein BS47DRAFT_1335722 [Hydnum rufescens UP504]|uniref:RBR-type E3 ubiquitin transferase n=1 Tax=Hydnum rufescens UP504 TaxID=1448309 RepID=A0A9P6E2N6_9AGAM|nr:hypothetical protein BS47DRAFT_1335722 [Hydnum rufescens UP504]